MTWDVVGIFVLFVIFNHFVNRRRIDKKLIMLQESIAGQVMTLLLSQGKFTFEELGVPADHPILNPSPMYRCPFDVMKACPGFSHDSQNYGYCDPAHASHDAIGNQLEGKCYWEDVAAGRTSDDQA